jgi:ATP-dependent Clp protease ATP-binding subunit ClpA
MNEASWFASLDSVARGALQRARDESDHADLPYIGTEQLLLGLLGQPRGIARRTLRSFGLELDSVRPSFEQWRVTSEEHSAAIAVPAEADGPRLTAAAKEAIEHAVERARGSGPQSIATEHLLQAILELEQGAAVVFLRGRGVDLTALRARTVQLASLGGTHGPRRSPRRSAGMVQMHAVERPDWEAPGTGGARNNVVMCRLDDSQAEAIDILIEAGVRSNRSDAAAWLIKAGLESKAAVVDAVREKVSEIRRLRDDARTLAEDADATA